VEIRVGNANWEQWNPEDEDNTQPGGTRGAFTAFSPCLLYDITVDYDL
jgi:hypothetical protein